MTEVLSPRTANIAAMPTLEWGHHFAGAAKPKSQLHRVEGSVLRRYEQSGAKAMGVQLASFIADNRDALPSRQLLPFKVYTAVADRKLVFEVDPHDTELWHRRLAANISRCIGSPTMVQLSIAGSLSRNEPLASNHEGLERLMEAARYDLQATVPREGGEPVPDERELPSRPILAVTTIYAPVVSVSAASLSNNNNKSNGSSSAAAAAAAATTPELSADAVRSIQDRLGAFKKQLAQHIASAVTMAHYDQGNEYSERSIALAVIGGVEAARTHEQSFCREANIADAGLLVTNVGSALQESLCKVDMVRLLSAADTQGKNPRKIMESAIRKTVEKDRVWQLVANEAFASAANAKNVGNQVANGVGGNNKTIGFGLFGLFGKTRCVRPAIAPAAKCAVVRAPQRRLYIVRGAPKCTPRTHYSEYSDDSCGSSSSDSDSDGSSSSSSSSSSSGSDSDNVSACKVKKQRHGRRQRCHDNNNKKKGKGDQRLCVSSNPLSTTTTTGAPGHVTNIVYNDNSRHVVNSKNKRLGSDSDSDGGSSSSSSSSDDSDKESGAATATKPTGAPIKFVDLSPSIVGSALRHQQQQRPAVIDMSPEVLGAAIIASSATSSAGTGVVLSADGPTLSSGNAKKPMTSLPVDEASDDDADIGTATSAFVNDSRVSMSGAATAAAASDNKSRLMAVSFAQNDDPNAGIYDDSDLLAMINQPSSKKAGSKTIASSVGTAESEPRVLYIRAINTSSLPCNVRIDAIPEPLATNVAPGAHTPFVRFGGLSANLAVHFEPTTKPAMPSATLPVTCAVKVGSSMTHVTVSPHATRDDSAVHAPFAADKPLANNSRVHVANMSDKMAEVNIVDVASFALRPSEQRALYVAPGKHIVEHRLVDAATTATSSSSSSQWIKAEAVLHVGNAYSLLVNGHGSVVQITDNRNVAQKQALCDKFLASRAVRALIDNKQCKGTLFVPVNAKMVGAAAAAAVDASDYYCAHTQDQHIEKADAWGNVLLTSATGRTYTLVDNKRALLTSDGKKIAVHGMWTTEANPNLVLAAIDGTHEQFSEMRLL